MRDGIKELLKQLKMTTALENFESYLKEYKDREKLLFHLLQAEVKERKIRSVSRNIARANFPYEREWSMIDHKRNPKIDFGEIKSFSNVKFVEENRNLCFIGGTGLGKTHSLVSIGRDLCRMGVSVKCYNANSLVTALEEAKDIGQLSKLMDKLMKPKLLEIDELGFVPFSEKGARLLFNVFSRRYERGSIAVTTNLSFEKWTTIFGGIELTAALIDRFTHKCFIYLFDGDSVRLQQSQEERKKRHPKLNRKGGKK